MAIVAAASHNASPSCAEGGFFLGFFSSETLELGFLFVLWKGGGEKLGKRFLQEMNFFS